MGPRAEPKNTLGARTSMCVPDHRQAIPCRDIVERRWKTKTEIPVDSGDSNRDLHMLQVTRGAQFPMVMVRTRLPEADSTSATIRGDLEIQFAGQTAQYKQVPFQLVTQGNETRISGIIPAKLSDFKIDPPTLLTLPVKNEIPVRVEMTWRPQ